jgi:predicted nucleic acid-binding protein
MRFLVDTSLWIALAKAENEVVHKFRSLALRDIVSCSVV